MNNLRNSLKNNPIFQQALSLAKDDEERRVILEAAEAFANNMISVFASAFASQQASPEQDVLVSERTVLGATDDGRVHEDHEAD